MIKNIKEFINKSKQDLNLLLLGLLILSLPFERIPSFDVFGITIRASLVVGGLVIIRTIYLIVKKEVKLAGSIPYYLLLAFVVWIILIIPESINIKRALQVVVYDVFVILLAASVSVIYKKQYMKYLLSLLFAVGIFVSVFALYQFFGDIIGIPYSFTGLAQRYTSGLFGFPRVQGFSLEPLYFGSFMLIPTMLAFVLLAINNIDIVSRKTLNVLLLVFSTVIFISVARGAIYGYAFGLLVASVVILIKKLTSTRQIFIALVLVIVSFILSLLIINYGSKLPIDVSKTFGKKGAAAFTQQLTNTSLNESDERAVARSQAINLIKQNKSSLVVGLGPGQFGPYVQNNTLAPGGWTIVNNLTLELIVETGLVGLLLIIVFFADIIIMGFKKVKTKNSDIESLVVVGLIGYLATQAVQYQGFSTLYVIHIWFVAGLLLGIIKATNKK